MSMDNTKKKEAPCLVAVVVCRACRGRWYAESDRFGRFLSQACEFCARLTWPRMFRATPPGGRQFFEADKAGFERLLADARRLRDGSLQVAYSPGMGLEGNISCLPDPGFMVFQGKHLLAKRRGKVVVVEQLQSAAHSARVAEAAVAGAPEKTFEVEVECECVLTAREV